MSSGCGCKEVYRFPHITYPYSLCSFLLFFVLVPVHFYNLFYNFSRNINKHKGDYRRPTETV